MDVAKIKQLREMTGAGIADCKKALEETKGDIEKATEYLKKQGIQKADKKKDRQTSEGYIASYVHAGGKVASLVMLGCETDFVARTDEFQTVAREIAMQVAAMNPKDVAELMSQAYIRDGAQTVESLVKSSIAKLGENIQIIRFSRIAF